MAPALGGIVEGTDVFLWLLMAVDGYGCRCISVAGYVSFSLAIMVLTLPFVIPMVDGHGFDLLRGGSYKIA